MEKKIFGDLLLKIGVIMFSVSTLLMIIFAILYHMPRQYWLIVSIFAFLGLLNFIIGGFLKTKDKSYRVVIIGVTMIFGSVLLDSLVFGVRGLFTAFSTFIPIIVILGIIFVICGALLESENEKIQKNSK